MGSVMDNLGTRYRCPTCVFYSAHPTIERRGQCRIDAPKLSFQKDAIRTLWPQVRDDDFCGQHTEWYNG